MADRILSDGYEKNGTVYDFIPPLPTKTNRGGIIAKEKSSTDTVEVKIDSTSGKAYVPKPDTELSTSSENYVANKVVATKLNELDENKADKADLVNGVTFKGSDTTANITAKTDAEIGDKWYSTDDNVYYMYSSSGWINCGSGENLKKIEEQIDDLNGALNQIAFFDEGHVDFTSDMLFRGSQPPTVTSVNKSSFEITGLIQGNNHFFGWEITDLTIGETYRVTGTFLTKTGSSSGDYIAQVMSNEALDGDALAQNPDRTNPVVDFEFTATQETHYLRFLVYYNVSLQVSDFNVLKKDSGKIFEHALPDSVILYRDADMNLWKGKTCLAYGDSITAISNGNGLDLGWAKYVNDYYGFSNFYGRGIGGQTFTWNTATFYANVDGSYNSRDTTHNPPEGTTEHKGCFCSWDRIKAMIPDSIKDTIDLILLMGGTNDIANVEEETGQSAIIYNKPVCNEDYTTDTEWVNDTDNYLGCDYDVTTFSGAIASTIMKLQVRCPNAIIVVATPLSRWYTPDFQPTSTTTSEPYENGTHNGVTTMDVADVEIKVARYMSMPHIDVNGMCGINGFNWSEYMEGVHPYPEKGKKMLARTIIGGLKNIHPMIN